jgi:tetratricopeptide (TPR) repeat protein
MAARASRPSSLSRQTLLLGLALAGLTVAIYWPVGGFAFLNYDDTVYVTINPGVSGGLSADAVRWAFTTSHGANWHPLTWLSHQLDVTLFGLDPGWHHRVNLLLHLLTTLLLFHWLARCTGRPGRSAFVAALFSLHPLHVESVAWVAERKDLVSALCGVLALQAYTGYARRPAAGPYLVALLLFALGLLAKPMLVTLPFLLLLCDWWPLGRVAEGPLPAAGGAGLSRSLLQLLGEKLPFLLLAAAASTVTLVVQRTGGAITELFTLRLRLENALLAYLNYLQDAFWPEGLAVIYPFVPHFPPGRVLGAGLLLAAVSLAALLAARRYPYLTVGWLWFLGMLVPVSGIVQIGLHARADRYTYLPLVGIFLAVTWGVAELAGERRQRLLAAAALLILAVLAVVTRQQLGHWRDSVSLFRHAVAVTEGNVVALNNLGEALATEGRREEAVGIFRQALGISQGFGEVHLNLGRTLVELDRPEEAAGHLEVARQLRPKDGEIYALLGFVRGRQGKDAEAIGLFREGLRLDPAQWQAHLNLGIALERLGDLPGALAHYREALRLNPGDGFARRKRDEAQQRQQRGVRAGE